MKKAIIPIVVAVLILIVVGLEYSGVLSSLVNSNTPESSGTHSPASINSYPYRANLNGTAPSPQASIGEDIQEGDNVSFDVSPTISIPSTDQYGNQCYITGSVELQIVSPTGITTILPKFTGYYTYGFTASQSGTYQFEFSVITQSYSQNYCDANAIVIGYINVTS